MVPVRTFTSMQYDLGNQLTHCALLPGRSHSFEAGLSLKNKIARGRESSTSWGREGPRGCVRMASQPSQDSAMTSKPSYKLKL